MNEVMIESVRGYAQDFASHICKILLQGKGFKSSSVSPVKTRLDINGCKISKHLFYYNNNGIPWKDTGLSCTIAKPLQYNLILLNGCSII